MIKAEFRISPQTNEIAAVKFSGHAGQNEKGHDIVCAAASALFIAVCNGLEKYVGIKPDVRIKGGDSRLSIQTDDEIKSMQAQTLLNTLLIAMQDLQEQHPDYISVSIMEEKK